MYDYDALGRRIRKADQQQITTYIWAGQQLVSEKTQTRAGEPVTQRDYLYFPNSFLPLAMRENNHYYYFHCGRRGEVIAMTDRHGEVVWQARYSAFGEAQIEIEKVKQPWRLAGHYYDEETALHYVLARYYQPQLGRFLTKDPLFHEGGSNNFYLYCDGDPLNRADPTGELVFLAAIAIGAAIGAAVGGGIEAYRQHKASPDADFDWGKIGKAAAIGDAIGAVGGGVGAAVEGAFAAGVAATVGGGAMVGGISGVTASIAEQCAHAALTGEGSISAGEVLVDGIIGSGIGAVTGGIGGWLARRAKKGAQDVVEEVTERAVRNVDETAEVGGKNANRMNVNHRTAAEVNAEFPPSFNPPYKAGARVTEYTTKEADQFVRVHGADNAVRPWMMRKEAVDGLSPAQIQHKYSLPSKPSHISDVTVPKGTRIRTGKVEPNFESLGGGGKGATQYEWLGIVPKEAVTNTRIIK